MSSGLLVDMVFWAFKKIIRFSLPRHHHSQKSNGAGRTPVGSERRPLESVGLTPARVCMGLQRESPNFSAQTKEANPKPMLNRRPACILMVILPSPFIQTLSSVKFEPSRLPVPSVTSIFLTWRCPERFSSFPNPLRDSSLLQAQKCVCVCVCVSGAA